MSTNRRQRRQLNKLEKKYLAIIKKQCQSAEVKFTSTEEIEEWSKTSPIPSDNPYRIYDYNSLGMIHYGFIKNFQIDHLMKKKDKDGNEVLDYNNPTRGDDTNKDSRQHIVKLKNIIYNKNWRPEAYICPTIKFEIIGNKIHIKLVTGWHTLLAHQAAGKKEMWVAVIGFSEYRKKSSKYWETNWQLVENKHRDDYAKLERSPKEIEKQVQTWINDKEVEKTEDDITQALKDLQCTATEIKNIRNDLIGKNGLKDSYVENVSADALQQKRDIYQKAHPNEFVIARKYDSPKDDKYEAQDMDKMMDAYIENPEQFRNGPGVIVSAGNVDKKARVKKIRESKSGKDSFHNVKYNRVIKFVETIKKYPDIKFEVVNRWVKQFLEDKEDFIIIK